MTDFPRDGVSCDDSIVASISDMWETGQGCLEAGDWKTNCYA